MAAKTRTFIALPVPPALGEQLKRLQSRLTPDIPAARWTTTEPFHTTLAFLGDVLDTDLNAVCKAVAEASRPFSPIELRIESVGAFPSPARPRVLWAGLRAVEPSLLQNLQQSIVKQVTRVGYRPDDQRFNPHVTLGRIRSDRRSHDALNLTALLGRFLDWTAGTFRADEVITFTSTQTPEGPHYAQLARVLLAGKNNVAKS